MKTSNDYVIAGNKALQAGKAEADLQKRLQLFIKAQTYYRTANSPNGTQGAYSMNFQIGEVFLLMGKAAPVSSKLTCYNQAIKWYEKYIMDSGLTGDAQMRINQIKNQLIPQIHIHQGNDKLRSSRQIKNFMEKVDAFIEVQDIYRRAQIEAGEKGACNMNHQIGELYYLEALSAGTEEKQQLFEIANEWYHQYINQSGEEHCESSKRINEIIEKKIPEINIFRGNDYFKAADEAKDDKSKYQLYKKAQQAFQQASQQMTDPSRARKGFVNAKVMTGRILNKVYDDCETTLQKIALLRDIHNIFHDNECKQLVQDYERRNLAIQVGNCYIQLAMISKTYNQRVNFLKYSQTAYQSAKNDVGRNAAKYVREVRIPKAQKLLDYSKRLQQNALHFYQIQAQDPEAEANLIEIDKRLEYLRSQKEFKNYMRNLFKEKDKIGKYLGAEGQLNTVADYQQKFKEKAEQFQRQSDKFISKSSKFMSTLRKIENCPNIEIFNKKMYQFSEAMNIDIIHMFSMVKSPSKQHVAFLSVNPSQNYVIKYNLISKIDYIAQISHFNQLLSIIYEPDSQQYALLSQNYKNALAFHNKFKNYTAQMIRNQAERIKKQVIVNKTKKIENPQIMILGLILRGVQIIEGYWLRDAQCLTILQFLRESKSEKNKFCQVNTGEGKTIIIVGLAIILALTGDVVDILTSNVTLAEEGVIKGKNMYSLFGLSVAHNNDNRGGVGQKKCYNSNIVYGIVLNFQGDYLRTWCEFGLDKRGTIRQNNFGVLIIDQVDHVVLDNASHVTNLSQPISGMAELKYLHIKIWIQLHKKIKDLQDRGVSGDDFEQLLQKQMLQINIPTLYPIPKFLISYVNFKKSSWVKCAIKARYYYQEDINYLIAYEDDQKENKQAELKIVPLDTSVGATMQNFSWTDLNQYLELKHNLAIKKQSLNGVFIANAEYIKLYKYRLYGLSGTCGDQPQAHLIQQVYRANVIEIPPFKKKITSYEHDIIAPTEDQWKSSIVQNVKSHVQGKVYGNRGQAVLIVCESIQLLKQIEQLCLSSDCRGIKVYTYLHEGDSQKIRKINSNGVLKTGDVIVATNIGGRGTDFELSPQVTDSGGLHTIISFLPSNKRIQTQAAGRSGRKGLRGSTVVIMQQYQCDYLINKANSGVLGDKDIRDIRNQIQKERIQEAEVELKKIESKQTKFTKFMKLYRYFVRKGVSSSIINDIKFQWAMLCLDLTEQKLAPFIAKLKNYQRNVELLMSVYQFVNPYNAVNFVQDLLENGDFKDDKDTTEELCSQILSQPSVMQEQCLFTAAIKKFEIAVNSKNVMSKNFSQIVSSIVGFGSLQYQQIQSNPLNRLNQAISKLNNKKLSIENIILNENEIGLIILSTEDRKDNFLLNHLTSDLAVHDILFEHLNYLKEKYSESSAFSKKMTMLTAFNEKDVINQSKKNQKHKFQLQKIVVYRQEIQQMQQIGGDCYYELTKCLSLKELIAHPKVKLGLVQIALGIAALALMLVPIIGPFLAQAAAISLISNGITDIIMVIIFGDESKQINWGEVATNYLIDAAFLPISKLMLALKLLRGAAKVGTLATKIATKLKFFVTMFGKSTKNIGQMMGRMKNIIRKGVLKKAIKIGIQAGINKLLQQISNIDLRQRIDELLKPLFIGIVKPTAVLLINFKDNLIAESKNHLIGIVQTCLDRIWQQKQLMDAGIRLSKEQIYEFKQGIKSDISMLLNQINEAIQDISDAAGQIGSFFISVKYYFKYAMKEVKLLFKLFGDKSKKQLGNKANKIKSKLQLLNMLFSGQLITKIDSLVNGVREVITRLALLSDPNQLVMMFTNKIMNSYNQFSKIFENCYLVLQKLNIPKNFAIQMFKTLIVSEMQQRINYFFDNNPVFKFLQNEGINLSSADNLTDSLYQVASRLVCTIALAAWQKGLTKNKPQLQKQYEPQEKPIKIESSDKNDCVFWAIKNLINLSSIQNISGYTGVMPSKNGLTKRQTILVLQMLGLKDLCIEDGAANKDKLYFNKRAKALMAEKDNFSGGLALMQRVDKIGHAYTIIAGGFFEDQNNATDSLSMEKGTLIIPKIKNLANLKAEIENNQRSKRFMFTVQKSATKLCDYFGFTKQEPLERHYDLINNKVRMDSASIIVDAESNKSVHFKFSYEKVGLKVLRLYEFVPESTPLSKQVKKGYYCRYKGPNHAITNSPQKLKLTQVEIKRNNPQNHYAFTASFGGCGFIIAIHPLLIKIYHDDKTHLQERQKLIALKKDGAIEIVRCFHRSSVARCNEMQGLRLRTYYYAAPPPNLAIGIMMLQYSFTLNWYLLVQDYQIFPTGNGSERNWQDFQRIQYGAFQRILLI